MSHPKQVDSKIPRAKAAFHTILPAAAFLFFPEGSAGTIIVALTGLAVAASVVGGPKVSLFGRLFTQLIRPALKLAPGQPDDAAPHRFSEALGGVFLLGSAALLALGNTRVGWGLALLVVALAALNWLAGICVGCQTYLLIQRLRTRGRAVA